MLDIAAAQERCDAASEGPWHAPHDKYGCVHIGDYGWTASDGHGHSPHYDEDSEQGKADAEFIAHARTDLPAALAEIERLRAGIKEVLPWLDSTEFRQTGEVSQQACRSARQSLLATLEVGQ